MGMNYYANTTRPCPNCDRDHDCQTHIGKSSMGWKFLFSTAFHDGLEEELTLAGLKEWLSDKIIRDESGEEITHKAFWEKVESKQDSPNDHLLDIQYCVVRDGYAFMRGEFS